MARPPADEQIPFPPIDDVLLDALDKAFALRNPPPDEPHHITQRRAGARDVIVFLKLVQQQQRATLAEE